MSYPYIDDAILYLKQWYEKHIDAGMEVNVMIKEKPSGVAVELYLSPDKETTHKFSLVKRGDGIDE
jgi:hypothetical protein